MDLSGVPLLEQSQVMAATVEALPRGDDDRDQLDKCPLNQLTLTMTL